MPVGETLRFAISEKGEVLLAIPNLENDSVLARAGVTAKDMENMTASMAAIELDKSKKSAMSRYWGEVATVADNSRVLDKAITLDRRNPFFNVALQTHYPQHLRFPLAATEEFGPKNPYFDSATGRQTTLLETLAGYFNAACFQSPRTMSSLNRQIAPPRAASRPVRPPAPAATAQAEPRSSPSRAVQGEAQDLGMAIRSCRLQDVRDVDRVIIPAYGIPDFSGVAGGDFFAALPAPTRGAVRNYLERHKSEAMHGFRADGVYSLEHPVLDNGGGIDFVRSPNRRDGDGQNELVGAYARVLNNSGNNNHIAIPLISAGGSMGFTPNQSVAAAVRAIDDFRTRNPGSRLQVTLCNPAMNQASLDHMLIEATSTLERSLQADPHELDRFVRAQATNYETAITELKSGSKRTYWMWFVFPQLRAVSTNPGENSKKYGLNSLQEAKAYWEHAVLGPRLKKGIQTMLEARSGLSAERILGQVDAMKFQSCLTLFAAVDPSDQDVQRALNRFYGGRRDNVTQALLLSST
jgi:uncharacterized protein (DUF1810 family)